MTETQIEIAAERKMDRLDAQFMAGNISQRQYDSLTREVEVEARRKYREAKRRVHRNDHPPRHRVWKL